MSAVADAPTLLSKIDFNEQLFEAIVTSTENGVQMSGAEARCVSISKTPGYHNGEVTALIGVHGAVSGFLSLNTSASLALYLVSGLLDESHQELSPQVVDGVGELTNIVAGGVKGQLGGTEWKFSQITIPSMIVGDGYQVAFGSGLELVDVAFDVDNPKAIRSSDRIMHVTLSLLKL